MGLRSIFGHEKDISPPTTRQRLNRDAISALFWVILTALVGIIVLSALGLVLRFGLFGAVAGENSNSFADEALSILGNIGSAAIGGLVGWLTRDQLDAKDTGYQQLPPEPTPQEVAMPAPIPAGVEGPLPDHGDPAYDPDLVFDDEPEDLTDDEVPDDVSDEGVEGE